MIFNNPWFQGLYDCYLNIHLHFLYIHFIDSIQMGRFMLTVLPKLIGS